MGPRDDIPTVEDDVRRHNDFDNDPRVVNDDDRDIYDSNYDDYDWKKFD